MVTNVTSLTGNGLKDWLIQRVTAAYLAVYSLFFLLFLLGHPEIAYPQWQALFAHTWVKVASMIALISLSLHAWIGIWTVTTDYLKSLPIRLIIQFSVVLWLLGQFIWGLMIMWGQ